MRRTLSLVRPPCPLSEPITCRFRLQGRCCHAGFEDTCPLEKQDLGGRDTGGCELPKMELTTPVEEGNPRWFRLNLGSCGDDGPGADPEEYSWDRYPVVSHS